MWHPVKRNHASCLRKLLFSWYLVGLTRWQSVQFCYLIEKSICNLWMNLYFTYIVRYSGMTVHPQHIQLYFNSSIVIICNLLFTLCKTGTKRITLCMTFLSLLHSCLSLYFFWLPKSRGLFLNHKYCGWNITSLKSVYYSSSSDVIQKRNLKP